MLFLIFLFLSFTASSFVLFGHGSYYFSTLLNALMTMCSQAFFIDAKNIYMESLSASVYAPVFWSLFIVLVSWFVRSFILSISVEAFHMEFATFRAEQTVRYEAERFSSRFEEDEAFSSHDVRRARRRATQSKYERCVALTRNMQQSWWWAEQRYLVRAGFKRRMRPKEIDDDLVIRNHLKLWLRKKQNKMKGFISFAELAEVVSSSEQQRARKKQRMERLRRQRQRIVKLGRRKRAAGVSKAVITPTETEGDEAYVDQSIDEKVFEIMELVGPENVYTIEEVNRYEAIRETRHLTAKVKKKRRRPTAEEIARDTGHSQPDEAQRNVEHIDGLPRHSRAMALAQRELETVSQGQAQLFAKLEAKFRHAIEIETEGTHHSLECVAERLDVAAERFALRET